MHVLDIMQWTRSHDSLPGGFLPATPGGQEWLKVTHGVALSHLWLRKEKKKKLLPLIWHIGQLWNISCTASQIIIYGSDFFLINLFIYLFLAVLGLRCCMWAFYSWGERGLLLVAVRRLLIVVASLAVEHQALGMQASVVAACRLSSCGSRRLEHRLSSCGAWA